MLSYNAKVYCVKFLLSIDTLLYYKTWVWESVPKRYDYILRFRFSNSCQAQFMYMEKLKLTDFLDKDRKIHKYCDISKCYTCWATQFLCYHKLKIKNLTHFGYVCNNYRMYLHTFVGLRTTEYWAVTCKCWWNETMSMYRSTYILP